MANRLSDSLFSFGTMFLGVILVLLGPVSVQKTSLGFVSPRLPVASERTHSTGGDLVPEVLPPSRPTIPLQKNKEAYTKPFSAAALLVVDVKSGSILFAKNAEEVRPLASITKLMSALVLLDLPIDWTTTTAIVEADTDGSSHHVSVGERFTAEDLWHVALIGSSNTAITALVRLSGLTEEQFVEKMNAKARTLHLTTLSFVEPTGLNSRNVGNSIDIAHLLKEALSKEKIYQVLHTGEYYAEPLGKNKKRLVWTTNWLLTNWIPSSFGKENIVGKTGYIVESGYNFAVQISGEKERVVEAVVLGANSNESRFTEARDAVEWAFEHYVWPADEGYDSLIE